MKTASTEIALHRWPYGLELQPSANGLLLRPRHKARANWAKTFRRPRLAKDDLAGARQLTNEFDKREWLMTPELERLLDEGLENLDQAKTTDELRRS